MADRNAFSVCFIINPLIALYQRVFEPTNSSSTSSVFEPQWENRFYALLNFLCFSPDQFANVINDIASDYNAVIEPKTYTLSTEQTFTTAPTVLLRAFVPSSGFTITFRALIDTGAHHSFIYHDLATLLFNNGASCKFIWPYISIAPFYKVKKLNYREVSGLTLQSVEDTSVNISTSILVDESAKYIGEYLPVDLVVEKMALLGLPMVQSGKLGRTMWSEKEPNSEYRVDMIIGQDLLNAHFNLHPLQRTYHITTSLAIIRTKMGLAFVGQFDTEKFKQWTLSADEIQMMKDILYPEKTDDVDMTPAQREEINNILTLKVSNKRNWKEYIFALFHTINFVYIFVIAKCVCFVCLFFKIVFFSTFLHHLTVINYAYKNFLYFLFYCARNIRGSYRLSVIRLFNHLFNGNSSISPDLMPFYVPPRIAVRVKSDTCTKTVWAFIDTGAYRSYISANLAKELNVETYIDIDNERKNTRECTNIEIGKPNDDEFIKIKLEVTSISFSTNQNITPSLFTKIANVMNIPLFDLPEENTEKLLIGTDLIPSLLYPSQSLPTRCFSLASNLNLIETRLGYYLQGTQINSNNVLCYNWSYFPLKLYFFRHFALLTGGVFLFINLQLIDIFMD